MLIQCYSDSNILKRDARRLDFHMIEVVGGRGESITFDKSISYRGTINTTRHATFSLDQQ